MSWLAWRQHRAEALAAAAVLAVLAISVLPSGLHVHQVVGLLRLDGCLTARPGAGCGAQLDTFNATSRALTSILPWVNILPGLLGVFIGAPLVAREIEDGTWRLAWSQGITRSTWMRGQVAGTVAIIALSAAIFTAVLTWWLVPVDYVNGRFVNNGYDFYGVIPLAWALLAFAAGVLAGTLTRRVVPAMAATFLGYLAERIPVEYLWRPRYLPAVKLWGVGPTDSDPLSANAWVFGQDMVAPHSHTVLSASQFDQLQHTAAATLRGNPAARAGYLQALNHYLQVSV
jgi:ABC-2 family transporter protein